MRDETASGLARTNGRAAPLAGVVGASPLAGAVGASPLAAKFLRPTIHRMGRRCFNWDYKGRGVYLVTIVARKHGRGLWGLVESETVSGNETVVFAPNETGRTIEREWLGLADAWPGVRLLAHQVMDDHFHGVIATPSFMDKPLGAIVGSFKARASSAVGVSLWSKGYVDTILFDEEAVRKAVRYVKENPWRLHVKREHPELFKVLRNLEVKGVGHFAAIGNHFLLDVPNIVQLQCSRSDFAYARDAKGEILRDRPPRVRTAEFVRKLSGMKLEIEHGAAVVSPCISKGAAVISYRGMNVDDVDRLVSEALKRG